MFPYLGVLFEDENNDTSNSVTLTPNAIGAL